MLEIESLHATYGKVEALHGVSLSVPEGRITNLLGPNGAGKTTLLRAVAGVARATAGRILLMGEDVTSLNVEKMFGKGVVYQPSSRELFPSMTVRENLLAGCLHAGRAETARRLDLVYETFPVLKDRMQQRRAGTMSGGEQQILALARAVMTNPRVLLLDEPSLGLAPIMLRTVFRQLQSLQEATSLTVLLAEQNARASVQVADQVYVIRGGEIVRHGSDADEFSEADLMRAYLRSDLSAIQEGGST